MKEINKLTLQKLSKWKQSNRPIKIDLHKVIVNLPIHLETSIINFNGGLGETSYANGTQEPIVVRQISNGSYQLLFGLKQLIVAKLRNNKMIKAIILRGISRTELIEYLNKDFNDSCLLYPIDKIKIGRDFSKTTPNRKKVEAKERLIKENKPEDITLNINGVLIDGYITYLLLKEAGLEEVSIVYG